MTQRGTLAVAPARDQTELAGFARRTQAHRVVNSIEIDQLEPALAGRFAQGLYFPQEAHLDPRVTLRDLAGRVTQMGVDIQFNTAAPKNVDLSCAGMAAVLPELRPVRGEMAILQAPDIQITRNLRLLHPRSPLYLVPRGDDHYMIGATMIESNATQQVSVRSLMELLGAAYALHPGFAQAAIVETGAGLRPAFPDNLPRLSMHDGTVHLNGLYRRGFLLAPAMATKAAALLTSETSHDHHSKRA